MRGGVMRAFIRLGCAAALCFVWATVAVGEVTTAQVNTAIERGVAYLEKQQRSDGRWTEHESEPGGATALCTLALLRSGRAPDSPAVRKALQYLDGLADPERTYSASLILMALAEADANKYAAKIKQLAGGLVDRQMRDDVNKGGWTYR